MWEGGGVPPIILNLGTASRLSNWPFPRGWWVMWCYTDIPPWVVLVEGQEQFYVHLCLKKKKNRDRIR